VSAAGAEAPASPKQDVAARALAALRISGRRLAELRPGLWAVLSRADRRSRAMVVVDGETVARLLADGSIRETEDGDCVLSEGAVIAPAPSLSLWALIAAGRKWRSTESFKGFIGLAVLARRGEGPLSMRQVKAGMRLVADAELETNSGGLTMNWDAGPSDRRRRGPQGGGQSASSAQASARLKRVQALAGEEAWKLAWIACVEGVSLKDLKARSGLGQRTLGPALARALEQLANAYER